MKPNKSAERIAQAKAKITIPGRELVTGLFKAELEIDYGLIDISISAFQPNDGEASVPVAEYKKARVMAVAEMLEKLFRIIP